MNIKQATRGSVIVMASVLALVCACGDEDQEGTSLPGPERSEGDGSAGPICGAVACDSDFPIELEQPGAWPLGTYEVFVSVAGGAMESCVIELGGPPVDVAKNFCAAESFTVAYVRGGRLNMSSNRGVASRRDFALGTGSPAITSVHVNSATTLLATVIVTGPDGIVSQGTFEPAWGEYNYPNGPECTPRCRSAPPQALTVRLPEAVSE